jgi:hypothetical protein
VDPYVRKFHLLRMIDQIDYALVPLWGNVSDREKEHLQKTSDLVRKLRRSVIGDCECALFGKHLD